MARKGAGILGVALFTALQPNMICGIHCAFYMPVAMRLAGAGVPMPMAMCHHQTVATSGHHSVVPDVSAAPPASPVCVSFSAGAHGGLADATRVTPSATPSDIDIPPPRAA